MAIKAKKEKKDFLNKKKSDSARPSWPHLPQQVLDIIKLQQPILLQEIKYKGISKSWRAASRKCNPIGELPLLKLSNNNDNNNNNNHDNDKKTPNRAMLNITFNRRIHDEYPMECYGGYSRGELVAFRSKPLKFYMWHPFEFARSWRSLPDWDPGVPFKSLVLPSPTSTSTSTSINAPLQRCYFIVLTGISHPAFVYYDRWGGGDWSQWKWTKQDCDLIEPCTPNQSSQTKKSFMGFANAVDFGGKIYALSVQGTLAVIEGIDSRLAITDLGTTRVVPSLPSKHFREYLFESNGEILLVFLISMYSIDVVDNVEVFRLNVKRLSWVKMESLGDRTLFMGVNCCMSVSARKVGSKSNSVYFTYLNNVDDGWWIYNMEKGSISPGSSDEYCSISVD